MSTLNSLNSDLRNIRKDNPSDYSTSISVGYLKGIVKANPLDKETRLILADRLYDEGKDSESDLQRQLATSGIFVDYPEKYEGLIKQEIYDNLGSDTYHRLVEAKKDSRITISNETDLISLISILSSNGENYSRGGRLAIIKLLANLRALLKKLNLNNI